MQGLTGVIFVESLHYFPFILMNLIVALRAIDGAMEEAALNRRQRMAAVFARGVSACAARLSRRCCAGLHQGLR